VLRCDNGPEFTSRQFLAWCLERGIAVVHIEPASRCRTRMWRVFMDGCGRSA
jgi:hypothetical protein